jgi:Zn-dependent M28 family amino/carboxypeptidase
VQAFEDEAAGYEKDPAKRREVEKRAMKLATDHYEAAGFSVKDVSKENLGYDLRCTGKKKEVHVEVKGTTTNGARVELTINEVNHARMSACPCRADLFVVSKIKVMKTKDRPIASGGVSRPFENWKPEDEDLAPIRFRYKVPTC